VTFTTPDAERLPLPSPRYLEIHAACAKIAHLSGAAEYIERVLEYVEEISVLADHGSSPRFCHTLCKLSLTQFPLRFVLSIDIHAGNKSRNSFLVGVY